MRLLVVIAFMGAISFLACSRPQSADFDRAITAIYGAEKKPGNDVSIYSAGSIGWARFYQFKMKNRCFMAMHGGDFGSVIEIGCGRDAELTIENRNH